MATEVLRKDERAVDRNGKILVVLACCSFLIGLGSLIVSPLVPAIVQTVQFSLEDGGLLITAFALLYAIGAPALGPFSDRWGRRKMLITGVIVFGVGNVLTAFGSTFAELMIYRAIAGLGGGIVMPSVYALIGDKFPYEKRGKAIGVIMAAMGGSTVLGIPLGSFFAQAGSWRASFEMIGLISLVIIAIILFVIPKDAPAEGHGMQPSIGFIQQFRTALQNGSARFALLSTFLWWAGFQGLFAVMGIFYYQTYHMSVGSIGIVFALAGVGNMIGSTVGGRVADRIGKKATLLCGGLISAIGVGSIPFLTEHLALAMSMHIIWAFATGLGQTALNTMMSEMEPKVRATIMSLTSSATYLGMTASSAMTAFVLRIGSFVHLGIICAICFLLAVGIISRLVNEQKQMLTKEAG